MDAHHARPSEVPCACCGAPIPVFWASRGHGVATCFSCGRESYIFDPPLPLSDLVVALDGLMWPAGAGAGAARARLGACDHRALAAPVRGLALISSSISTRDP